MEPRKGIINRDLTYNENDRGSNFTARNFKKGDVVYENNGLPEYGINSGGVMITQFPGEYPVLQIPIDSVDWQTT